MKSEFNESVSQNKSLLILSVISIIAGAISAIFGEVMIIFSAGFLAAVFTFDGGKRIYSIFSALIIFVVNFLLSGIYSLVAPEIILIALIIAVYFRFGRDKSECAALITLVVTVIIVLSMALGAIYETKEFSFESVFNYYGEMFGSLKDSFMTKMEAQLSNINSNVTSAEKKELIESFGLMFDSLLNSILSVMVIIAFAVAGFTLKLYTVIYVKLSKNPMNVLKWRFSLSPISAYATAALIVCSFFFSAGTDVFSIAIVNLSNIFEFVFAYVGFTAALSLISMKLSVGKAWLILIIAILISFSFAIMILAALGIFFTVMSGKFSGDNQGVDNDENRF